jgi:hypothetical protein
MMALEICYSARNQADLEALLAGQRALQWLAEVLHVNNDYDMIAEATGQSARRLFRPGARVAAQRYEGEGLWQGTVPPIRAELPDPALTCIAIVVAPG